MKIAKSLFLLSMLVVAHAAFAGDAKNQPALRTGMLVSTEWLAGHLNDPKVVILQVAEKKSDYDKGHLPGARFLAMADFIADRDGLRSELPPIDVLQQTFAKLGVSDDSHVVIYTSEWYPLAARAYYTLDYLGHGDNTSLLDGGIQQWQAEKRPISKEEVSVTPAIFTPHVQPAVRAMFEEAQSASQNGAGNSRLVDARPEKRYLEGHLPGAAHVYWRDTVVNEDKSPVLLPPDKLRAMFAEQGLAPDQKLITYCEIGWQASHTYFVAKYLGYDAAMYDGSFNEWDGVRHQPTVKGDKPR